MKRNRLMKLSAVEVVTSQFDVMPTRHSVFSVVYTSTRSESDEPLLIEEEEASKLTIFVVNEILEIARRERENMILDIATGGVAFRAIKETSRVWFVGAVSPIQELIVMADKTAAASDS